MPKTITCIATLIAAASLAVQAGMAAGLDAAPARIAGTTPSAGFDGVVEAVRQTVIAAQVPGAIVQLEARTGDSVRAGQVLVRIDARAADQTAAAGDAQVAAARAALEAATRQYERQKQLFAQHYISQAALDNAESDYKATRAQVSAQLSQAGAARTQSGFYIVRAPYDGVIADVPVMLGDMAMPGRALVTLYDPAALRITAAIPQTVAAQMATGSMPRAELPGLPSDRRWVTPARVQILPIIDPATHTVQMRVDLPPGLAGAGPGMFARLWLPLPLPSGGARADAASLMVPLQAIVRRAEMTGLYVLDPAGKPVLRQVRLGRTDGDRIEVLSGLMAGERVVTDAQAAARVR